jgi:hypothetical protein
MAKKRDGENPVAWAKAARGAVAAPPTSGPPPPTQYNPADYQNQLASQLSPGFSTPTPIQGQFPMQGQAPMGMQPGFGQGGFNPQQGLFGSFAPQGGMFSGMFGGQR